MSQIVKMATRQRAVVMGEHKRARAPKVERIMDDGNVVYIRMVSEEQLADEREAERFRELWRPREGCGLPLPGRSLPIQVWALLREGPLTAAEIAEELKLPDEPEVAKKRVEYAIRVLREHGQDIFNPPTRATHNQPRKKRKYHLIEGEPLKIVEGPNGLRLALPSGRLRGNEVLIELK